MTDLALRQAPLDIPRAPAVAPDHDIAPQPLPASHTPQSSDSPQSQPSSPEVRPVDPRHPILEEDEDETSSETANEPVTPTDASTSHDLKPSIRNSIQNEARPVVTAKPPISLQTPASPKTSIPQNGSARASGDNSPPQTPAQSRPLSRRQSSHHRRSMNSFSSLFTIRNRSAVAWGPSPYEGTDEAPAQRPNASEVALGVPAAGLLRRFSAHTSPNNSTRSNSPPSPVQGPRVVFTPAGANEPLPDLPKGEQFFAGDKKKHRAATTLSIKNRLFHRHDKPADNVSSVPRRAYSRPRHRTGSIDSQDGPPKVNPGTKVLTDRERLPWSLAAEAGTGVKARRMSLSLPDDFTVDVVELHSEFSDQSKRFGKRGKTLGKGATSQVMLMTRKGYPNELYAVKEFRKKASTEKAEEYEKKVKSEYSIAKSLHHPNIVETVRLCTHNGRWEHVMEWCSEGDLFNLVQKNYLKLEARLPDRLCLFKQLVQGIHYLHSNGIAHRDIKLENLLISQGSKLKITDFGVSEVFSGMHPGLRAAGGQCGKDMGEVRLCEPGICGSMPYIAPEVISKHGKYDPRPLDVWSAAVVMLHLIFGGALWTKAELNKGQERYEDIVTGWTKWNNKHPDGGVITETDYPHVRAFDYMVNPPALRRLLIGMLNPDPARRTTIAEAAGNRWIKTVECCQVDSFEDPTAIIDATKKVSCRSKSAKVAVHNHLPEKSHPLHHLVRLPGSTDMDYY